MAAFFSVITPTYNRARLIGKAIDSLLQQTFTDWELLIVDDGSTDNTRQVVEAYTDPRIKYIYQINAERSVARNNGIAHASGKYICFLDSDDYYLPNRLELLHSSMIKRGEPVALFYTGIAINVNGVVTNRSELVNTFDNIYDFIVQAIIGNPQVCAHRVVFEKYKFDSHFYIGEDMELWLRLAGEYQPIYLDNQFTVVAMEHDGRSVNVARYNSFINQLQMLRHALAPSMPGYKISEAVKAKLFGNAYYGIAKYYIHKGDRFMAIKNMVISIVTDRNSRQLKFRVNVLLKLSTFASFNTIKELIKY